MFGPSFVYIVFSSDNGCDNAESVWTNLAEAKNAASKIPQSFIIKTPLNKTPPDGIMNAKRV